MITNQYGREIYTNAELIVALEKLAESIFEKEKIPPRLIAMYHDWEGYFCGRMPSHLFQSAVGPVTTVEAHYNAHGLPVKPSFEPDPRAKVIFDLIIAAGPSYMKEATMMHCLVEGQTSAVDYIEHLKSLPPDEPSHIVSLFGHSSICLVEFALNEFELEELHNKTDLG